MVMIIIIIIIIVFKYMYVIKCAVICCLVVLYCLNFSFYSVLVSITVITHQMFKLTNSEDLIQDNSIRPPVN